MFDYSPADRTCHLAPHAALKASNFNLVTEVVPEDVAVYVLQCSVAQESLLPKQDYRIRVRTLVDRHMKICQSHMSQGPAEYTSAKELH